MNRIRKNTGFSLVELMVALILTTLILTSGYGFYVKMHNQTIAQSDISEMQQNSRVTLYEIVKTARMAGYKIGSHTPYRISNDTLIVYYNDTQPVDTFMFYLEDYEEYERLQFGSLEESRIPKKLMKKHNSDNAEIYTDYIHNVSYTAIDTTTLQIILVVQAPSADEDFIDSDGVRYYTCSQQVNLRNINL